MSANNQKKVDSISYSFGMVDLVHFGHITALKRASENADLTIFGLVSDGAADAWFGAHVSNEEERKAVIESIRFVDYVMPQDTFDPIDNLRSIHEQYPDAKITLFHGNEWGILSAKKYIESIGGQIVKLDYYDKMSPQRILDVLNRNKIEGKRINSNLISTKANTLLALSGLLSKSKIEDILIITINDFRTDCCNCTSRVLKYFKFGRVVVRSSSSREDAFEESNAGHFRSVLDVPVDNQDKVKNAITDVIDSYGENANADEQILIQRQTENVMTSGVIFNRDIQRNRPYYVINYDDSGRTDSVTSGIGGKSCWLSIKISDNTIPNKWKPLMEAVREIEMILSDTLLDIEFAVTKEEIVIFQVRPLAAAYKFGRISRRDNEGAKELAIQKYLVKKKQGLTMYSDMAFWNPAEIIGDNPRNLDYSLYRYIITKKAWNIGIFPLGYRNVPKELMYKFGNKPYINLERSFEALIPSGLSDDLVEKLKFFYIGKLKKDMSSHDKIEFEISHNCYDFSLYKRLSELKRSGFTKEECAQIEAALRTMTIKIIHEYDDILLSDQQDLKQLEGVRLDVQNVVKGCKDYQILSRSVHTLLDAIVKFGTPQFSRQARCAFIAKSMIKSLVNEGYLESQYYDEFFSSIKTVAEEYNENYQRVLIGDLTRETFLSDYGHLRAGTYNIRSPRYDEMNFLFGGKLNQSKKVRKSENRHRDELLINAFNEALGDQCVLDITGFEIVSYIRKATEKREYFKFIFTKSLSFAIEIIKFLGSMTGTTVDDLSYLELPEIFSTEYYSDIDTLSEFWHLIIKRRKEVFDMNSNLILPSVICSETDFEYIENIDSRPNYITESKISANVYVLDGAETTEDVEGKIVCVEKADPGFDWLFSKNIAGLVTKYGGSASHMAIRCAEFRVPAAIGCGNTLYDFVLKSDQVTIDCKNERIIRKV